MRGSSSSSDQRFHRLLRDSTAAAGTRDYGSFTPKDTLEYASRSVKHPQWFVEEGEDTADGFEVLGAKPNLPRYFSFKEEKSGGAATGSLPSDRRLSLLDTISKGIRAAWKNRTSEPLAADNARREILRSAAIAFCLLAVHGYLLSFHAYYTAADVPIAHVNRMESSSLLDAVFQALTHSAHMFTTAVSRSSFTHWLYLSRCAFLLALLVPTLALCLLLRVRDSCTPPRLTVSSRDRDRLIGTRDKRSAHTPI